MTVYIDDARIPATVANGRARHTSLWSHLFADTEAELHKFAARLGLRRSYFRPGRPRGDGQPSPFWHYDLTEGKRRQAVALGAHEVPWRQAPAIMRANEADRAAGRAWRAGDLGAAARLIRGASELDPSRRQLWAERMDRISASTPQADLPFWCETCHGVHPLREHEACRDGRPEPAPPQVKVCGKCGEAAPGPGGIVCPPCKEKITSRRIVPAAIHARQREAEVPEAGS